MRRTWVVVFLVLGMASQALAGFPFPKHVVRMSQLEKAGELAKSKKAPITFVYTDEDTD